MRDRYNYNVSNKKLAALYVAIDVCSISCKAAVVMNPLERDRFLVNYRGISDEEKCAFTDALDNALDEGGFPWDALGTRTGKIHIVNEKVLLEAGAIRVEISYVKRNYRVTVTRLTVRKQKKKEDVRRGKAAA
jgi:hypothetical protein